MKKIRFKDLCLFLKIAVIGGFVYAVVCVIAFIYGFLGAI